MCSVRAEKEAKRDEKACIRQLERSKRQAEKEKKRTERQLHKEKLKAVSLNVELYSQHSPWPDLLV